MLEDRAERNRLRHVILKAQEDKIITKEEAGFVVTLVERFRNDIEKKVKELHTLQGEIGQLKSNEQIVIDIVQNLVKAAQRDVARQETAARLRDARKVEEARHAERKKAWKEKSPEEQADSGETLKDVKEPFDPNKPAPGEKAK